MNKTAFLLLSIASLAQASSPTQKIPKEFELKVINKEVRARGTFVRHEDTARPQHNFTEVTVQFTNGTVNLSQVITPEKSQIVRETIMENGGGSFACESDINKLGKEVTLLNAIHAHFAAVDKTTRFFGFVTSQSTASCDRTFEIYSDSRIESKDRSKK